MSDKKPKTPELQEDEVEVLAIESAANMGELEFDRIEDHGDSIFFYSGDQLTMIVPMSLEEFSKFVQERYNTNLH
jgi:hypothetical protein